MVLYVRLSCALHYLCKFHKSKGWLRGNSSFKHFFNLVCIYNFCSDEPFVSRSQLLLTWELSQKHRVLLIAIYIEACSRYRIALQNSDALAICHIDRSHDDVWEFDLALYFCSRTYASWLILIFMIANFTAPCYSHASLQ